MKVDTFISPANFPEYPAPIVSVWVGMLLAIYRGQKGLSLGGVARASRPRDPGAERPGTLFQTLFGVSQGEAFSNPVDGNEVDMLGSAE